MVVITWNAARELPAFLAALRGQEGVETELVVVDNGSRDRSVALVREEWPEARVLELGHNSGFAVAANAGIKLTTARFVALLNYDVEPAPGYLRKCVEALTEDPALGSVQGLLLRPDGKVDSAGHAASRGRWFRNRGENLDATTYREDTPVFGVTGGAGVYRRQMLDEVAEVTGNVFEPGFFAYLEDVDLDYRARWLGWQARVVASALAVHRRSGSGGRARPRVQRHIIANRILVLMRNEAPATLLSDLPWVAGQMLARWAYALLTCPSSLLGVADAVQMWPAQRVRRRAIIAARRASPAELRPWFRAPSAGFHTRTGRAANPPPL